MGARLHKASDTEIIRSWLVNRGLSPKPDLRLPKVGMMVDDVAAGFMVETDARYCLFEYFVCNPAANHENRYIAFNQIMESLCELAKDKGYDMILGMTEIGFNSNSTLMRVIKNQGFTPLGKMSVVRKELL